MIPMEFSAFEANAKSWVHIVVFFFEFLYSNELCVNIFLVLGRKQSSKVDGSKETSHLENDLKAMQYDLWISHNLSE